jgi:hypothetical protein
MFGLMLREQDEERLVYSTSVGFRIVFLAMALVVILCIAAVPEGDLLSRLRPVPLLLIAVCLLAASYLERWTFDRKANLLERNSGLLFLHTRRRIPLDSLRKVILRSVGAAGQAGEGRSFKWTARGAVIASVVDGDGKEHRIEMDGAGSSQGVRALARNVAAFCAIPLEEDPDGASQGEDGRE